LKARSEINARLDTLENFSFYPDERRADKLVVVGEPPPYDGEAKTYVKKLRRDFFLPIEYQQLDIKSGRLK
jgi:hypothetical protein